MNKTLWQIRDSIMEALHSYEITDDRVIDPELVEDKIIDLRSSLINEEHKAGPLDLGYYQIIENLEVIYGINTIPVSAGVTVSQTRPLGVVSIPGLDTRIGRKGVLYFGVPDMSMNFDNKTLLGLISNDSSQYTKKRYCYSIIGEKVYVKNYGQEGKRFVTVVAVFADPRKIPGFDLETSDFPVSDPQKLELLVIKHFLTTLGFPPDKMNDANVNLNTQK